VTRRLTDEVSRRRRVAVAGHRSDLVTVRAHMADPSPSVRATALGGLARAGGMTAADLLGGLDDEHPSVRARAAELCAVWPGDRAPALGPLLQDLDPSVVEAAAWASGERTPPEPGIVPALAAVVTGHDDPLCREAAVAALGALGDPAGLPAVLAATTDRPAVRRRAVLALAPFDGPAVDGALARAHDDRDWQVRQAAEDIGR